MNTKTLSTINETLRQAVRPVGVDEIRKYKEERYLIFRNMVPSDVAEGLRVEIMEIMNVIGLGHTKLRQTMQYLHGSLLSSLINGSLLREAASALMESPAHLYTPFSAVKKGLAGQAANSQK